MKVLSLFTGAGGLDLGLEAAGFETSVCVEMDPVACRTLRHNRGWPIVQRDIHDVASAHLLDEADFGPGEATLLVGGPPCQPFSKSGFWARGDVRRLGDPRASTIEEFLRVLAATRPLGYILENVPGLGYRRKDEGLRLFRDRLQAINLESRGSKGAEVNYSCHVGVLDASDYGVPQRRSRLFVVGHRDGAEFDFGSPTHGDLGATESGSILERREPKRCTWDAIGPWEDDDDPALALTGKWASLLPAIPEGRNYQYLTNRGGGAPIFGWRTRYWSFLLKLAKAETSWTITAQPGPSTGPFHWRNRRLSARELGALQTFPSGYHISGEFRSVQRQLGNAVPCALAEYLGLQIRRQFLGQTNVALTMRKLVPNPRRPLPPVEAAETVPDHFRGLIGEHAPHPGAGSGPGALAR